MTSRPEAYAIIPARGGSKSIPKKNMVPFGGAPLIERVIKIAKQSALIERVICTTDSEEIGAYCESHGIEYHRRPNNLATDSANVADAVKQVLEQLAEENSVPEFVALLQPTSPFIREVDINNCLKAIRKSSDANSVQTVSQIAHNFHAYNQREVVEGRAFFKFKKEREKFFNKQKKPIFYKFANLVVTRSARILEGEGFFVEPSLAVEIPELYSFDLDKPEDLRWGEYCLVTGLVNLDEPSP
jgi:CMP-N,N'-diacetyllegionaminic acid synthase